MLLVAQIDYKGHKMRVKFEDGSTEDSLSFRRQYLNLFRNYPNELVPTAPVIEANKIRNEVQPIGVLPSTGSLGGFGALPDMSLLTSIIENVRRASQSSETATTTTTAAAAAPTSSSDCQFSSAIEGTVHTVTSKLVLIKFSCRQSFAKMIPGQMFIDGKKCLGFVIKSDPFQRWPQQVKTLLQPGAKVQMDVQILSDAETAEISDITSEVVTHSAPTVWRANVARPNDHEMVISRVHPKFWVLKGVVVSLYPKWGVLRTSSGEVFFESRHLHVDQGSIL